ncbi:unnamed protein product [Anisakis simplex]|uniref:Uncharacterized protein n=1 Tax=Anisakis simplex TaxID=6269 RepID=A0A0M3JA64_ANISI|nr:unnamed protein product [Anisakis simplex]
MESEAANLQRYLDDGVSMISGSSAEEVERRIITDVTRTETRTTTIRDAYGDEAGVPGGAVYQTTSTTTTYPTQQQQHSAQFIVHNPIETEAEQYATTTSDHFMRAGSAGGISGDYHSRSQHMVCVRVFHYSETPLLAIFIHHRIMNC